MRVFCAGRRAPMIFSNHFLGVWGRCPPKNDPWANFPQSFGERDTLAENSLYFLIYFFASSLQVRAGFEAKTLRVAVRTPLTIHVDVLWVHRRHFFIAKFQYYDLNSGTYQIRYVVMHSFQVNSKTSRRQHAYKLFIPATYLLNKFSGRSMLFYIVPAFENLHFPTVFGGKRL